MSTPAIWGSFAGSRLAWSVVAIIRWCSFKRMYSSEDAMRAAAACASPRSSMVYRRLDSTFTNWIAPRTRPRFMSGTAIELRSASDCTTSRASSVAPDWSMTSSSISGKNSLRPERMTAGIPVGALGSYGKRFPRSRA